MGLDSLFERLVVASERQAAALDKLVALVVGGAAGDAEITEAARALAAAASGTKPRGRKAKEPEAAPAPTVAEVKAEVVAEAAATATKQRSFLDDEDEPAEVEGKQLTEAEHRAEIRKRMLELQKALDPDRALSILVKHGKAETLKALKPENFQALYAAIAEAMPK